ncbi:hypothetical protein LWI28_020738 [Acer negundo]|uniref:Uncharacterized protein n=1 Tax=Acer negundo TaxID=4023 RepID=A0AAD5IND1_ACENE|nr:hypothetical protein LWI28_020738 [Acer negundo]
MCDIYAPTVGAHFLLEASLLRGRRRGVLVTGVLQNSYAHDGGQIEVDTIVEWSKKYVVDYTAANGAVDGRDNV